MAFHPLVRVRSTGSTNSDLLAGLTSQPESWPHLAALVADEQREGRGRQGRSWHTPPGRALTVSIALDPQPDTPLTWLPLLLGLAARRALTPWVQAALKWPNDLVCEGSGATSQQWRWGGKLGGILCELHPSGRVVAGVGINCLQTRNELPVPWAVSLRELLGPQLAPSPGAVLSRLATALPQVLADWQEDAAAVRAEYEKASCARGRRVLVAMGSSRIEGLAGRVDEAGRLEVRTAAGSQWVVSGDLKALDDKQ